MPHALLAEERKVGLGLLFVGWLFVGWLFVGWLFVGWLFVGWLFVAGCSQAAADPPLVEVPPAAPITMTERTVAGSAPHPRAAPPLVWLDDADAAFARARHERRDLLVFVHADWSAASLTLDRRAWRDERVRRAAIGLVPLRVDVSETTRTSEERALRFGVARVPAVLLVASDGRRIAALEGPVEVDQILELLARAHQR